MVWRSTEVKKPHSEMINSRCTLLRQTEETGLDVFERKIHRWIIEPGRDAEKAKSLTQESVLSAEFSMRIRMN